MVDTGAKRERIRGIDTSGTAGGLEGLELGSITQAKDVDQIHLWKSKRTTTSGFANLDFTPSLRVPHVDTRAPSQNVLLFHMEDDIDILGRGVVSCRSRGRHH